MTAEQNDMFPASFAQQRLWFLDQLQPSNAAYNVSSVQRLRGAVNVYVLEESLNEIVRRHEALRTRFEDIDGEPMQVIESNLRLKLKVEDVPSESAREEAELEKIIEHYARQQTLVPFKLSEVPLLRAQLLRLGPEDHVLLLTLHHIVSDGWSVSILCDELAQLYEAYSAGQASPLAELEIQYADFSVWQREWLQGAVLEEQLSYWKEQLAGAPAVLSLPTDFARPAVQSNHGQSVAFVLERELTEGLKELSRQQNVTLFMTLLAAFQILLYRYSGQADVVVGTPIAGRNREEIEPLIGFFVNTLVLRTKLDGKARFADVLEQVKEVALAAYAHQDVPFEKLVEELRGERSLSYGPLFQVLFVLQNTPHEGLEFGGLQMTEMEIGSELAKFDLMLSLKEHKGELQGWLQYNKDLFRGETIERMSGHWQELLQGIVAQPEQRVGELPLLSAGEREQLLVEFNDTGMDHVEWPQTIHELFEAQVERQPEAVAVRFGAQQVSYGELNRRANQVAWRLRRCGVGPEVLVGVLLERSVALVVGLLGVLKAGGAYVPLDGSYPEERLRFMLADAGVAVLLTEEKLRGRVSGGAGMQEVYLDGPLAELAGESEGNPESGVRAENLAYVIYTSGSTGRPKGTLVSHRSVVNLKMALDKAVYAGLQGTQLRVSLNGPAAFDTSVKQLLQLLNGHALYILPEEARRDGEALLSYVHQHSLDVLDSTPSMLSLLIDAGLLNSPKLIPKVVLVGGERIELPMWQTLTEVTDANFYNVYGPTECTVDATLCRVSDHFAQPSIGRPLANYQIYILDEQQQLVPVGVSGELHIAGAGLARGYLGRAEVTAEKFVPHPYSGQSGARLYRTGDMGRYRADGEIEYQGRRDQQVKVRGFRIELGEVEAVLRQHAGIREAVVLAREDEPGDKRLVAYVVWEREAGVSELREWMKQQLPEYMVPTGYVSLAELPLTANGKVDRAALPAPDGARPELADSYVAPRTAIEEVVAGIWSKVLKVERVGVHDNFFALGGHSLLATQVMARVRQAFKVDLLLRVLFESTTIANLAKCIESLISNGTTLETSGMKATAPGINLPLSFAQQRLWFLDQLQPNNPLYNIMRAVRIRGPLNIKALEQSFNEIVQRHEILRTTFMTVNDQPVQVINQSVQIVLSVVDISALPEKERETEAHRLSTEEARTPFDLSRGPLLRAQLLRLGAEDHVLLLTMHHIVSDGWSVSILQGELARLYEAYSAGQASPLAELEIQYADFSVWQREWLQGAVLEEQLSYWKEQLAGAPAVLSLPTDFARPAVQSNHGQSVAFVLERELTEGLKELSRQQNVTLFMTLLAAFQILLYRYSGQADVVVGTPIAGRNREEIEPLIGFFVNTLVLRTKLDGKARFADVLEQVKEVALAAYAHQDVPFEKLVEELRGERSLSYGPLFQVLFVLQNTPHEGLEFGGLQMTEMEIGSELAKFDLMLSLKEHKGELQGWLQYNKDLFRGETIERMSGHWQELLQGIVAQPEQRVGELPLLSAGEREQLLVEFNDTGMDHVEWPQTIHELFEAQVERQPEAVAVRFGAQQVSYGELNRRANQVAWRLRRCGVGPEVLVGVLLERSVALVVGLLGVLKAGGAYVPLDGSYPEERLRFMLADAGVAVLLTEEKLRGRVSGGAGMQEVYLDGPLAELAGESEGNPESGVRAENLAYVIYTSGSTGRPKGVAIAHRSAAVFLQWAQRTFARVELAGMLASTSICFDLSVFELFAPLSSGGQVLLAENALALGQVPGAVRLVNTVPSAMAELLRLQAVPASVQRVNLAGEPLPRQLAQQLYGLAQVQQVTNLYGPTEATTYATWGDVGREAEAAVTIGRPVAGTQVYILDQEQQLVPLGVSGELHIAGEGLARGYLGRAEVTAEKFVPHPYSGQGGARLYRTGDMGRYRADGEIEYQGRRDQQVKVRGFRIELGEVEAVLRQHASIREAVVLAREDEPGDKRLVAYVVWEREVGVSELREWMKQQLPEYMVPTGYVSLAELPLTANGKVDRAALPAPDGMRPELADSYVAPRTAIEEAVAGIWSEVLKVERVGMHDNFFHLGGHSLLATQVISKLRRSLEVEVPLRTLFTDPTVAGLSHHITEAQRSGNYYRPTPIGRISREQYRVTAATGVD